MPERRAGDQRDRRPRDEQPGQPEVVTRAGAASRRPPAPSSKSIDEAAAKPAAMISPTGVAITNPTLRWSSSTPGVASACNARKPAPDRHASPTSTTRASARRHPASLISKPRPAAMTPSMRTSQKCAASRTSCDRGGPRGAGRRAPRAETRRQRARRSIRGAPSASRRHAQGHRPHHGCGRTPGDGGSNPLRRHRPRQGSAGWIAANAIRSQPLAGGNASRRPGRATDLRPTTLVARGRAQCARGHVVRVISITLNAERRPGGRIRRDLLARRRCATDGCPDHGFRAPPAWS